ncbi:Coenzyme Q-binding protein coq10, mitochondrial [Erysiphe neolycopersici]|uniref:Coenzyme Q-binding protein coq10, mitochondrial n=1 Tax=Erysiphe neolycopersici TaxID=212602 RepID=A0A420HYQ2_9PEZI|nr:Coenzyme Q-binding protein coq10, mitochondrial [Erysiphe neolycopersici]
MILRTRNNRSFRSYNFKHQIKRNISSIFRNDNKAQNYSVTRILPYESTKLYKLIADIDSYSTFVPFCKYSKITKRYLPDKNGDRWPAQADLTTGWFAIEEQFTSRIYCIPNSVVEALSGEVETSLTDNELLRCSPHIHSKEKSDNTFQYLRTTWTLKPYQNSNTTATNTKMNVEQQYFKNQTQVSLNIEFKFLNPLYTLMSEGYTPKVARIMIEAFQKRAYDLLREK